MSKKGGADLRTHLTGKPFPMTRIDDLALKDGQPDRFSNPLEARRKAMDFLARREYGREELTAKLAAAGFDEQVAASAVAQLARDGLQDDYRFAESFVQSRVHQGKGPVRIRLELGQRGVKNSVVELVLEECGVDWSALARSIRERKFGAESPVDFREKARQMRFLQYRGFEHADIQAAFVVIFER
jgi:regulatory protein